MSIPSEMALLKSWVVWALQQNKDEEKPRKVPYSVVTKRPFKQTKEELGTLFECIRWLETTQREDLKGVGFYISKENNISCIDLDNCIKEDRTLTPIAKEIKQMFKDTYIEVSQSGKGLHIWCKGSADSFKTKEVELYSEKRFIALTDNALIDNDVELANHQKDLEDLVIRFSKETTLEKAKTSTRTYTDTIERQPLTEESLEVMQIIANSKKAKEFEELYSGKVLDKEQDKSKLDMALIGLLTYFAQEKEDIVINIFINSELGKRDKALRKDYILRSIDKAKAKNYKKYKENTNKGIRLVK